MSMTDKETEARCVTFKVLVCEESWRQRAIAERWPGVQFSADSQWVDTGAQVNEDGEEFED